VVKSDMLESSNSGLFGELSSAFAEEAYGLPRGEMELVDRSLLETFGEVFNGVDYSTAANYPLSLQPNNQINASMMASSRNGALSVSNSVLETGTLCSSELKAQSRKTGGKGSKELRGEDPAIVARDKRRERNKVLARKTRQKKKAETEGLRDKLVALMAENEKLKEVVQRNLPTVSLDKLISADMHLPENILKMVNQMISVSDKVGLQEITIKQRSFCLVNALNNDYPLVYVSPGFVELTGYSREECLGRNCRFLQGPETDKFETGKMREALLAQQDVKLVLLNYRKDGTPFWNQIEVAHLRDSDNNIRFVIAVQNKVDSHSLKVRLARQRSSLQLSHTVGSSSNNGSGHENHVQEDHDDVPPRKSARVGEQQQKHMSFVKSEVFTIKAASKKSGSTESGSRTSTNRGSSSQSSENEDT